MCSNEWLCYRWLWMTPVHPIFIHCICIFIMFVRHLKCSMQTDHSKSQHTNDKSSLKGCCHIMWPILNLGPPIIFQEWLKLELSNFIYRKVMSTKPTRSIWKILGPFATARRRYIAIHQVSLLSHASYSYSAGGVRCPWQRRQRMTEGTAMAPWNGPNNDMSDFRR